AGGVAGREVGDQGNAAERDLFAVLDDVVDLDGREGVFLAEARIGFAAALEEAGVGCAGIDSGAGPLLYGGLGGDVIEMGLAVDHDLDVAEVEAEGLDVVQDDRGGGFIAGVEEEVAGRRGDEV